MKAPMDIAHNEKVPPPFKFTPSSACELAFLETYIDSSTNNVKKFLGIGLVIDLSNAKSYYKPKEFTDYGILHEKIPCLGFKNVPSEQEINILIYKIRNIYRKCL